MEADDDFAREALLHVASHFSFDKPFYNGMSERDIAALYLLMTRLFPRNDDAERTTGFIGAWDSIEYLRDGIPRYLAGMGTEAAVLALSELIADHPQNSRLTYELSLAERAMRIATWSPLSAKEVLALADNPSLKLVTSPADLCEVLVAALEKFNAALHGAQTPVRDLWDRQRGNDIYRPIDESALSDVITRFLRVELGGFGIFANREVEIGRAPGGACRATDRHFGQCGSSQRRWRAVRPDRGRHRDEGLLEQRIVYGTRSAVVSRLHDPAARAGWHLFGWLVRQGEVGP